MEPRFQKAQPHAADEQRASNTRLAGGPPQLSVELKASEPSVRRATIPVGKLARTAAFVGEAAPASVEVVDDLVYAAPEEKVHEIPVQKAVDVDILSREAAGEVSEVFPIQLASSADVFDVSTEQEVEAVTEVEVPSEPTAEPPPVTPEWAAFDPDFSAVGEPVFTSEIAQPAWLDEPPTFASDEVIASVESAFGEHVEPASFEPAEVQNETTTFASEEVIASVESALGEDVEPATFESMEVQNVEVPEPELEPIAQGQPVPYQTPAEITEPEPEVSVAPAEEFFARAAALAGLGSLRPSVESPSLAPQVVSTDSSIQQLTTPATMPESTITPAPGIRIAPAAGASPATIATSAAQSAVQITFSFEIASMQLTSAFKMGTLQLKPISKVVAMRLSPSQHPQPAMNLQVTFEVSAVQLAGNAIGTIRLTPSQQQKPSVLTTPSFAIAGLQLVSGSESAPVQLTPSQQGQTSVHVTAAFQIATVEFSPTFEIASLILNSTSKRVSVQLPGVGPSAIESAPIFEMTNVQLTGSGDIGMINLSPSAVAQRRV